MRLFTWTESGQTVRIWLLLLIPAMQLKGKYLYSQVSVYVHGFPQPYFPSVAMKDFSGNIKSSQVITMFDLICLIKYILCVNMTLTLSQLFGWHLRLFQGFVKSLGQAVTSWSLSWCLLFFLRLCFLSPLAGGAPTMLRNEVTFQLWESWISFSLVSK